MPARPETQKRRKHWGEEKRGRCSREAVWHVAAPSNKMWLVWRRWERLERMQKSAALGRQGLIPFWAEEELIRVKSSMNRLRGIWSCSPCEHFSSLGFLIKACCNHVLTIATSVSFPCNATSTISIKAGGFMCVSVEQQHWRHQSTLSCINCIWSQKYSNEVTQNSSNSD